MNPENEPYFNKGCILYSSEWSLPKNKMEIFADGTA